MTAFWWAIVALVLVAISVLFIVIPLLDRRRKKSDILVGGEMIAYGTLSPNEWREMNLDNEETQKLIDVLNDTGPHPANPDQGFDILTEDGFADFKAESEANGLKVERNETTWGTAIVVTAPEKVMKQPEVDELAERLRIGTEKRRAAIDKLVSEHSCVAEHSWANCRRFEIDMARLESTSPYAFLDEEPVPEIPRVQPRLRDNKGRFVKRLTEIVEEEKK